MELMTVWVWSCLQVTVDVTPNGRGDSITAVADDQEVFVKPEERRMKFEAFLPFLHASRAKWLAARQASGDVAADEPPLEIPCVLGAIDDAGCCAWQERSADD